MNICFVHEEYPEETNFGGIATYQKIMAEELVKLGHKVYVICRGLFKDKIYLENGVKIYRIYVSSTNDQIKDYINYRKRVAKLLMDLQQKNLIDIIEVPDWGAETIFFESERQVPLVVRLHTPLKVWLKYNKNNFGKVKKLLLTWEDKMIKSANLVTCCSDVLKRIVIADFEINSSQILVTPNPANIVNFYRDFGIKKEEELIFVGSIEERKGVCILAQALNVVFMKYPNLKMKFVGKDTCRNRYNISTSELIYRIIEDKYKKNIQFVGQLPNEDLNKYLNFSRVSIFPSLFDNFPYVVLEAMATGIHIVGSKNSGMVEMLNDNSSIYETGNYMDLAQKIIDKYELSLIQEINSYNIDRVKSIYNSTKVSNEMLFLYRDVINKYRENYVTVNELQIVLSNITSNKIISYEKESNGVANLVFKVVTEDNIYIIKKYLHNYDFYLSDELYIKYQENNLNFSKPINDKLILYDSYNYNIFEYIDNDKYENVNIDFLEKLVCCNRKVEIESTLYKKCQKYYLYLIKQKEFRGILKEEVIYVINIFEQIKNIEIIKEKYLNHGDISDDNILRFNNYDYIIDFDEVTVTTPLYDFAVIVIKNFVNGNKLDYNKYYVFRDKVKKSYSNYVNKDYSNILKYYLCKILIEKFYLHQIGKINLYSERQQKDNYKRYLEILREISENDKIL